MEQLNKKTYSLLKYIYKHPYIWGCELASHFNLKPKPLDDMLTELHDKKMIAFREADCLAADNNDDDCLLSNPLAHFVSLPAGDIYVESKTKESRRWKISNAIAIIAAIGTILGIIISIFQQITQ